MPPVSGEPTTLVGGAGSTARALPAASAAGPMPDIVSVDRLPSNTGVSKPPRTAT